MKAIEEGNYLIDISYHFLHLLLARSKSQALLTLKGRWLCKGHDSLGVIH